MAVVGPIVGLRYPISALPILLTGPVYAPKLFPCNFGVIQRKHEDDEEKVLLVIQVFKFRVCYSIIPINMTPI